MNILLLSVYELGHQPLAVASPAAHLRAAGHAVQCLDLAVQRLDPGAVRAADLIALSVPMHTALRLGVRHGERVCALNPSAHVCYYGLYATLNAEYLLAHGADSAIGGEFEGPLVALAAWLAGEHAGLPPDGVQTREHAAAPFLGRQMFLPPARDLLPPLEQYVRLDTGTERKITGYVEASRGCAHECLHCPITPVYGGRLRIVQQRVVLQDIDMLVSMGARHITFGDPDFFNGVRHSMAIVRAMHAAHPEVSFDVTIKVEHLLEHRALLPELRALGCAFVLSAVESVSDMILAALHKGHTAADVRAALGLMRAAGLPLRPSFVAFTPWTTLDDYLALLDFVDEQGLVESVDPVQYAIRLLVPPGSSLLGTPEIAPHLGEFRADLFTYTWRHPDERMDALCARVGETVEERVRAGDEPGAVFASVHALALRAAGRLPIMRPHARPAGPRPPRLTENWFC